MARKALIVKSKREKKFKVRNYNRCELCGRPRAYLRDFWNLQIMFQEARTGR